MQPNGDASSTAQSTPRPKSAPDAREHNIAAYMEQELAKERRLNNVVIRRIPATWPHEELAAKCRSLFGCATSDVLEVGRLPAARRPGTHSSLAVKGDANPAPRASFKSNFDQGVQNRRCTKGGSLSTSTASMCTKP